MCICLRLKPTQARRQNKLHNKMSLHLNATYFHWRKCTRKCQRMTQQQCQQLSDIEVNHSRWDMKYICTLLYEIYSDFNCKLVLWPHCLYNLRWFNPFYLQAKPLSWHNDRPRCPPWNVKSKGPREESTREGSWQRICNGLELWRTVKQDDQSECDSHKVLMLWGRSHQGLTCPALRLKLQMQLRWRPQQLLSTSQKC